MERTIGIEELTRNVTELVYGVLLRGDRYVISRYGKPAAALVPLAELEQIRPSGRRIGLAMKEIAAVAPPIDPDELERKIAEEIAAVRAERRGKPE